MARLARFVLPGFPPLLDPARGDGVTDTAPVFERVPDYAALLKGEGEDEALSQALRRSESTGRPLGGDAFLEEVETVSGRNPRPGMRGPKTAQTRG